MRLPTYILLAASWLLSLAETATLATAACNQSQLQNKNRVFVLSDISNEPDDAMSFVRLLLHSNMYHIEGMVAVTSWWLNSSTFPDQIENVVTHYGKVWENLRTHDDGQFPTEEYLLGTIRSGSTLYGLAVIDALENGGNVSDGAQLLIDHVDSSDSPLYVQLWAGASCLGEALWKARKTRSPTEFEAFTSKLRVYSISDQDNVGPWIRYEFPSIRYIASIHGWNQYGIAAWPGISGEEYYAFDKGGPDTDLVSNEWIKENIQIGPLGSVYPDVEYVMEGDSPSLLFTARNGLNTPEYPEYGGWGGRYTSSYPGSQHFGDVADHAEGKNGDLFVSNHATIWRWREAYQNEMAARMQWTLRKNELGSNTTEPPVVILNGSCGFQPLELNGKHGTTITLDASESYNPSPPTNSSSSNLNFKWWHYREVSSPWDWNVDGNVPQLNISSNSALGGRVASFELPEEGVACKQVNATTSTIGSSVVCQIYHIVLEVTNEGTPPLTRYRRIVVNMQPSNGTLSA